MNSKKIALTSILLAFALIIGTIETLLPPIIPAIPYFRLGLSNLVVLFSMLTAGALPTALIVIAKSIIVPMFAGNPIMIIYSLCAALSAYFVTLILIKTKRLGLLSVSAIAAITHNVIQIAVAVFMTSSPFVLYYLPILAFLGGLAGYAIGYITYYTIQKFPEKLIF